MTLLVLATSNPSSAFAKVMLCLTTFVHGHKQVIPPPPPRSQKDEFHLQIFS